MSAVTPVSFVRPSKKFGYNSVAGYTKEKAEREIDELKEVKKDIEARIALLMTAK